MVAPDDVIAALGSVTGARLRTRERKFACDLVVMCGQRVPDAGLLAPGRRQTANGTMSAELFCRVDLPAHVIAVGDVTGGV